MRLHFKRIYVMIGSVLKFCLIMFIVGHIFIIEVLGGKFYGIWKDQR